MKIEPRFPNVDWYCDRCNAYLNSQENFNDHKYIWKCKNCGYKNSISWDNIVHDDNIAVKFLLRILGLLSYVGFATSVMLAVAMFGFHADRRVYFASFTTYLLIYVFSNLITIIVQFVFRRRRFSIGNVFYVIFEILIEDITVPFMCVKELISSFLAAITNLLPIKKKYVWHINLELITLSIIYLLITIIEIVIFSRIVGFGLNKWFVIINGLVGWIIKSALWIWDNTFHKLIGLIK